MNAVPVHQALFWPGEAPVSPGGEADFGALAEGLARADYRAVPRGALGAREEMGPVGAPGVRKTRAGRKPDAVRRQPYSCAQHAVVVSRAVEALAVLNLRERRVLATHAWLAEVRQAELNGDARGGCRGARRRLALRFMEIEALADVFACTMHWDGRRDSGPSRRARDVDRLLTGLARMAVAERNRLALYALLSELLPAGLGPGTADAALRSAGLAREAPAVWVEVLRFVRRMADETVRRDLPRGACAQRTGFPELAAKIEPLAPLAASRLWLERFRVLREAGSGTKDKAGTGEGK